MSKNRPGVAKKSSPLDRLAEKFIALLLDRRETKHAGLNLDEPAIVVEPIAELADPHEPLLLERVLVSRRVARDAEDRLARGRWVRDGWHDREKLGEGSMVPVERVVPIGGGDAGIEE